MFQNRASFLFLALDKRIGVSPLYINKLFVENKFS